VAWGSDMGGRAGGKGAKQQGEAVSILDGQAQAESLWTIKK
jgi:hypothetical protein